MPQTEGGRVELRRKPCGAEPTTVMSGSARGASCPPPALTSHLHAVPLHRPPQGVHRLPTDQDAQVDQQHAPHNHKQLLVFDDLQRERAKGSRRESCPDRGSSAQSLLGGRGLS